MANQPESPGGMTVTGRATLDNGTAVSITIDLPEELFVDIDWSRPDAVLDRTSAKNTIHRAVDLGTDRAKSQAMRAAITAWDDRTGMTTPPASTAPAHLRAPLRDSEGSYVKKGDRR